MADSKDKTVVPFTPRDVELMAAALKSMKSEVAVDYEAMATRAKLKNSASAKASWHGLKKKLDKCDGVGSTDATITAAGGEFTATEGAPKGGKKRKAAEAKIEEGGDGDAVKGEGAEPETPKKGKGRKKVKAEVPAGDQEHEGEAAEEAVPENKTKGKGTKAGAKGTTAKGKGGKGKKAAEADAEEEAEAEAEVEAEENGAEDDGEDAKAPAEALVDVVNGEGESEAVTA